MLRLRALGCCERRIAALRCSLKAIQRPLFLDHVASLPHLVLAPFEVSEFRTGTPGQRRQLV
jgi:hypothetical protein